MIAVGPCEIVPVFEITASVGTISEGKAHIELHSAPPREAWPDVICVIHTNFVDPTLITPERLSSCADTAIYTFCLPRSIIRSIRIHFLDNGMIRQELSYGEDYEILDLMPRSVNGVLPASFVRKSRIRHRDTLQFMAEQVSNSDEYNAFVQIEAAKILSYAAIEDGCSRRIESALQVLDAQFSRIEWGPSRKGNSKEHPLHITVSLGFIRIIALLMIGRHEDALVEMTGFEKHVDAVAATPIIGFNLSLALVMLGWILARGGDATGAIRRLEAVVDVFRCAASSMPATKSKTFGELSESLKSATAAIDLISGLTGRASLDWDGKHSALMTAKRHSRLSADGPCERLAVRLDEAAALVASRRANGLDSIIRPADSEKRPRRGSLPPEL